MGERSGDGQTDAAARSGHHRSLAMQLKIHRCSFLELWDQNQVTIHGDRHCPPGAGQPAHLPHEGGHVRGEEDTEDADDRVEGRIGQPGVARICAPELSVAQALVERSFPGELQERLATSRPSTLPASPTARAAGRAEPPAPQQRSKPPESPLRSASRWMVSAPKRSQNPSAGAV